MMRILKQPEAPPKLKHFLQIFIRTNVAAECADFARPRQSSDRLTYLLTGTNAVQTQPGHQPLADD